MLLILLAQAVPVPPKPLEIDFPPVDVNGKTDGPAFTVVQERPAARFISEVKVRKDFDAEIARSADEVR